MRHFKKLHSGNAVFIVLLILIIQITNAVAQAGYKKVGEAKGLPVGVKVKNFTATNQYDKEFNLYENLKKGPMVLLFYRGQWCPVCNRHLSQLQDSLQLIYDKGASVVAISPEKPELLRKTAQKTSASFTLLYDEGYTISDAFDVTFEPDERSAQLYNNRLNAELKEAHSDESQRLPIPATFIIDQNGKIVWRQFNPDYKKRATTKQIIEQLDTLTK